MRILVLEDMQRFATLLKSSFETSGFVADIVETVAAFEAQTAIEQYDLLIVDLGLPDGNGLDAIRRYRKNRGLAPVIVITARNTVSDVVGALDCGADDYLTKPFHFDILMARIRALLRRPKEIASRKRCIGRLTLDQQSGEIHFMDGDFPLTATERRLLAFLIKRAGSIVSKNAIEGQIHSIDRATSPNAIEQLVSRLRKSLARSDCGVDLRTVRGIGYVLEERVL